MNPRRHKSPYDQHASPALSDLDDITANFCLSRSGSFQLANDLFLDLFRFADVNELQTSDPRELFVERQTFYFLKKKLAAKGSLNGERALFKRNDGSWFWGAIHCSIATELSSTSVKGLVLDITSQVKSEEMIRQQAQEIEKLSAELDRFIYSASHDLRSPISSALGIINMMKLERHDEKTISYVCMIESSMKKLDEFVRELVSHSQNSRRNVNDSKTDVVNLVKDVIADLQQHPASPFITPVIASKGSAVFFTDRERIRLIVHHILKNSFDYYDPLKSVKTISIDLTFEPDKCTIEIFDNGIGISPTHVGKVFDMFYRGSVLSKGPGLGLYMAKEAATRLGGNITLFSQHGIGTSVQVVIPNSIKGRLINRKNSLKPVGVRAEQKVAR